MSKKPGGQSALLDRALANRISASGCASMMDSLRAQLSHQLPRLKVYTVLGVYRSRNAVRHGKLPSLCPFPTNEKTARRRSLLLCFPGVTEVHPECFLASAATSATLMRSA